MSRLSLLVGMLVGFALGLGLFVGSRGPGAALSLAAPIPGPARPLNLVLNGDFETGQLSPWTGSFPARDGGQGFISSGPTHTGAYSVAVMTNAAAGTVSGISGGGTCTGGVRVPVNPNTLYTWTGWVFVPANTALSTAYIRVAWYSASDCTGGQELASNRSSQVTAPAPAWVQLTGTTTSPADATFAEIRLLAVPADAASVTVFFDDITFDVTPPTATPTPRCPSAAFADTCPTDWYYPYVTDLASQGAITGYACGDPGEPCAPGNAPYFRPNNTITRAQVCKVVVLAFGLPITTTAQVFADVPPSHPFFDFINTAASRGIISGYTCGGPGEPCDPQARPYFRPSNNIIRGQISKVIVQARQWPSLLPPTPTFNDVPASDPFYAFIETAYHAHIIAGYGCGGPGEPCDPLYRPYFRAYNVLTRAQGSKMIDLARTQTPPTPTPTGTAIHTATPRLTRTPTETTVPPSATQTPAETSTATPTGVTIKAYEDPDFLRLSSLQSIRAEEVRILALSYNIRRSCHY